MSVNVAGLLSHTALFGSLEEQDRMFVASQMRAQTNSPGTLIFSRGDPATDLYLVVEGRIRLSVLSPEGRELSFALAEAGDIFGEIAVLDGGQRSADATTLTKVSMMTLRQSALQRLIETNANVAKATIRFLCARIRQTDVQFEDVVFHPIEIRLAKFLLRLLTPSLGASTVAPVRLKLNISQSELALLLGSSRQKVNEALAMLEQRGVVRRLAGEIECMPLKLQQIADPG
jgi:CRP-like cAMP-binding protein